MRFEIGGQYHMSVDQFWEDVFFDADFNDYLHLTGLKFRGYEILDADEQPDGRRSRVLRAQPNVPIPMALQRLLGRGITYIENGRFDPIARSWETDVQIPGLENKLSIRSVMRFEDTGPNRCVRSVVFNIEARIFGVGRLLEKFAESALKDNYEQARLATNTWYAQTHQTPSS